MKYACMGIAILASAGLVSFAQSKKAGPQYSPQYSRTGDLLFPDGYRRWTFVTAGLGMTYGPTGVVDAQGNPNFDNVFVGEGFYQEFLKTGAWPDKTMLIVEARASASKASINKGGHFQSQVLRVEAHVKDASKGGWGFYLFEPGNTHAPVLPKTASCYSCHEQNGAVDSTFVQFYPTLVDAAREHGTYRELTH